MAENSSIQQNEIIFRMGEETGIVIERENFNKSLFREHYVKALQLANDIIGRQEQDASSNVIAFCADRGEGKTSCMQTVAGLLTIKERYDRFKEEIPETKNFTNINPKDLHRLAIIDPAFFDEKHNIIELITGMMYETLQEENEDCNKHTVSDTTKLVAKFRDVQKSLEYIEKASSTEAPIYDALEKVQTLSQGLVLPKKIEELMDLYLEYIGKKRLVICIDDIDLNILYANRMIEQIRKYLSNKKCIILFATNMEQLTMVIRHSMEKELYGRTLDEDDRTCHEMAAKYVTKLLPTSHRINLVHIVDLYDQPLVLKNAEGKDIHRWAKVKEAITQLIYAKTRYLFYNNESETSPIVPTNLRSFRHLMKLLTDLPTYHKTRIRKDLYDPSYQENEWYNQDIENKNSFKNYFYQEWVVNNLTFNDAEWVESMVDYSNVSGLNKLVIQYLAKRFSNSLNFNDGEENKTIKEIVRSIISENSRTYNITLGDVFYCISLLESELTNTQDKLLLFFIKSFYSMRMYEYYDVITEREGTLFPITSNEKSVNIYPIDNRFENTNILQRFVNGSYFTYSPNDFMAYDETTKLARDLHVFAASNLRTLYNEVLTHFRENPYDESEEWILKLNICEFFLWTMNRKGISEDKGKSMVSNRSIVQPLYFGEYPTSAKFFVFDVLAPFYNATNLEYAYNRLGGGVAENEMKVVDEIKDEASIAEDNTDDSDEEKLKKEYQKYSFYKIAKSNKLSLLHLAIAYANMYDDNEGVEEKDIKPRMKIEDYDIRFNTLLSQSIIRNADVLISLNVQMIGRRSLNRRNSSDILIRLSSFYSDLKNANMSTYETEFDDNYWIRFAFADAFVDFLKKITVQTDNKEIINLRNRFVKILTTDTIKKEDK